MPDKTQFGEEHCIILLLTSASGLSAARMCARAPSRMSHSLLESVTNSPPSKTFCRPLTLLSASALSMCQYEHIKLAHRATHLHLHDAVGGSVGADGWSQHEGGVDGDKVKLVLCTQVPRKLLRQGLHREHSSAGAIHGHWLLGAVPISNTLPTLLKW